MSWQIVEGVAGLLLPSMTSAASLALDDIRRPRSVGVINHRRLGVVSRRALPGRVVTDDGQAHSGLDVGVQCARACVHRRRHVIQTRGIDHLRGLEHERTLPASIRWRCQPNRAAQQTPSGQIAKKAENDAE